MMLRLRWFAFMLPLVGACSVGTAEESTAAIQSAVGSPMVGAVKSSVSGATGAASCAMSRGSSSGPLIVNPAISLVFWGSYWNQSGGTSDRLGYDGAWSAIGNSPAFYNRIQEYGIGMGTYSGASVQNTGLANNTTLAETSIQNALAAEINAGALPAVTANTTYVIMLPPTVTSQTDVSNGFAGHHGFFVNSSKNIYYAVIEYNSGHNYNNPVISHEISDAATDPDTSTGYRNATGDPVT